jgi:hypothetical protein
LLHALMSDTPAPDLTKCGWSAGATFDLERGVRNKPSHQGSAQGS